MNGMIFDWADNSQNILDGKGYTTKAHQTFEQIMLFRYLLDLGYTYDEIYKKWVETNSLLIQRTADDMQERQKWFAKLIQNAVKKKIYKGNEIKIYQEEIDFINNMNVSLWVKQYILTLLSIYRWYGKEWCVYNNKVKNFCYSVTKVKREREESCIALCNMLKRYKVYEIKIIFENSVLKFTIDVRDKTKFYSIKEPREINNLFHLLNNQRKCDKCGRLYNYSDKSPNKDINLCHECYLKHRKQEKLRQK